MAALLGMGLQPAHEERRSILLLDREPIRWGGEHRGGLGWIEGDARTPPSPTSGWRAAAAAGVCGLAFEGGHRFLHSAVNGMAPLYWLVEDGAIYFASRIDPLVRTAAGPLSIDWDAWASIIAFRYPVGQRTPFAEIRRLPPSATLCWRFRRAKIGEKRWPWAEIEPSLNLDAAAGSIAAAVREALQPLPGGVICPLSGGRDSRMLFMPLARDGRAQAAITVPDDEGDTYEEDLAAPVAAAFGVTHEQLRGAEADYPSDWEERARRVEYEFVDHAWLVPLAHRVAGLPAPVPDGFAIDAFLSIGRHFYTPEVLATEGRAGSEALFETVRRYGHAHRALEESFQAPLLARAREQFLAAARPFEGHPSQPYLSFYATRSLRGVSTYATKLLGDGAMVVTPGASDAFVRAALSVSSAEKAEGALYRATFRLLGPDAAALPSTADVPRRRPHLPRRWCSPAALEAHRRSLDEGPLAAHLSPELRTWLEAPTGTEPAPDLRLGVEAIALLHAWHRRYRKFLRPVDGSALRG
jgi:hypothetical protein